MRVLYLANNWLGWQVLTHLRAENADEIAGLVVHPPGKRRFGPQILSAADLAPAAIFEGGSLRDEAVRQALAQLECDIALSVLFDYILEPEFLSLFPRGVLNLHPSYLPYNRGQYPNVWSIVERTPAGVTLHYLDAGIDTGDIVAQREVPVAADDTGETLYHKLEVAALDLFRDTWPAIRAGTAGRRPQNGNGTSHRTRDVQRIDRIDLDATYRAGDLIDILRARTFPPHRGAYFEEDGRRVYVRLELESSDEPN